MTAPANNTPNAIIQDAMQDAGRLQDGATPTGEQYAKHMRSLSDIINLEITQGLKLWLTVDTAVPITAGKAQYNFNPAGDVVMTKPMRVLQGYYLFNTSGVRRGPLTVLSWNDYLTLGMAGTGAGNQGTINSYFVDKQQTSLNVTFWLCPDINEASQGVPHVLLETQATNPVNLTETVNFPQEWRMYLRWALADQIATGQPQAIMDRCTRNAERFRKILEDWDVEDAPTQLQPDPRMQQGYGRFK